MNVTYSENRKFSRSLAVLLSGLLGVPFFTGLAIQRSIAAPSPVEDTSAIAQAAPNARPQDRTQDRRGLSTGQKVAILAGAAALYYLYQRHRNRQGHGAEGQYYLSKNGRVYYRDAQRRVHWVTPPPEGIRVPEAEASQYRDFQGYNGRSTGRDLRDLANDPRLAR
jgi:hypothetical protein